jgi:hypothetical protein
MVGGLGRLQPGFGQGQQGGVNGCHARFVVQMAGADETGVAKFHAGIKGNDVADLDAQAMRFFAGRGDGVYADFGVGVVAGGVALFAVWAWMEAVVGRMVPAIGLAAAGEDGDAFAFDGGPGSSRLTA